MSAGIEISMDDAQIEALDRYIAATAPGSGRQAAIAAIVQQALRAYGGTPGGAADEGLKPEQLNSSNDY